MDVGTVQSPAVNVTMPGQKAGTPVPAAESKPLAPMGTCIGARLRCCGLSVPITLPEFHPDIHLFCIFKGS